MTKEVADLKRWGPVGLGTLWRFQTIFVFVVFLAVNLAGFGSLFAASAGVLVGVAGTLRGVMPERMEAYRRLGYDNTVAAVDALRRVRAGT